MPRKRRYDKNFNETGKPNVDAQRRAYWEASIAGKPAGEPIVPSDKVISWQVSGHADSVVSHSLLWLLAEICADSYLRIVPDGGMGINHWFIKYTRGQWAGHYLYFAQRPQDPVPMATSFLGRQYHEVYAGLRKPTKDSAFGHGNAETTGL